MSDFQLQIGKMYFDDPEMSLHMYDKPALISTAQLIQIDKESLLVTGGLKLLLIKTNSSSSEIHRIISELNGTKLIGELLARYNNGKADKLKELVGLLFRHGYLEEGNEEACLESIFYSKLIGNTRIFNSGADSYRAIRSSEVCIVTDSFDTSTELRDQLSSRLNCKVVINSIGKNTRVVLLNSQSAISNINVKLAELNNHKCRVYYLGHDAERMYFGPVLNLMSTKDIASLYTAITSLSSYQLSTLAYRIELLLSGCSLDSYWSYSVGIPSKALEKTTFKEIDCSYVKINSGEEIKVNKNLLNHYYKISSPPLMDMGIKIHDAHTSSKNLMNLMRSKTPLRFDSSEIPSHELIDIFAKLENEIKYVFGGSEFSGEYKRYCPSGGNLGSPHALFKINSNYFSHYYFFDAINNNFKFLKMVSCCSEHLEVFLTVLGDEEIVKNKYSTFGENLVRLDSGVVLSYLFQLFGEKILTGNIFDLDYFEIEAIEKFTPLVTVNISDLIKNNPKSFILFKNKVLSRHSTRKNVLTNKMPTNLSKLLESDSSTSLQTLHRLLVDNPSLTELYNSIRYNFIILDKSITIDEIANSLPDKFRFINLSNENARLVNQLLLSESPILINISFELTEENVKYLDKPSYHKLLTISGLILGNIWLNCEEFHLTACPAGGFSFNQLRLLRPEQYDSELSLFTLCLGGK